MNDLDKKAFFKLFDQAYQKCFGKALNNPISEAESKHFSNEILEATGLVLGWKSIKNYALYRLNPHIAKPENPSVATLDTLARYVNNASKTDELQRKRDESHFSYWFTFRDNYLQENKTSLQRPKHFFNYKALIITILCVLLFFLIIYFYPKTTKFDSFRDDFNALHPDSLRKKGWFLKNPAPTFWKRRGEKAGHLTLFTLAGDNYPDTLGRVGIKNLLMKKIETDCFFTEIHLNDFIPRKNWQQVGLLLLEDSTYSGKSIRFSLAYNDFFGGYNKPGEIIIQAISHVSDDFDKPEEMAHLVLFNNNSGSSDIIKNNLQKTALRIEKNHHHYRLLYATGSNDIFAFKEVISRDLPIKPRYIGIFAISGHTPDASVISAYIDTFILKSFDCYK